MGNISYFSLLNWRCYFSRTVFKPVYPACCLFSWLHLWVWILCIISM